MHKCHVFLTVVEKYYFLNLFASESVVTVVSASEQWPTNTTSLPKGVKFWRKNTKRRTVFRNEFVEQVSDPFRHASGEGGIIVHFNYFWNFRVFSG
jgi:hypothetical protein